MMAAVAVAAISLAAFQFDAALGIFATLALCLVLGRRTHCLEQAAWHGIMETRHGGVVTSDALPAHRRLADYHGRMRKRWERAARYPGLPVAADPPPR
jgi:hypothetical protein